LKIPCKADPKPNKDILPSSTWDWGKEEFRLPLVDLLVDGTKTERHRNLTNSGTTFVQMIHPEKGKTHVFKLCFKTKAWWNPPFQPQNCIDVEWCNHPFAYFHQTTYPE
jgi:hypothetical protein